MNSVNTELFTLLGKSAILMILMTLLALLALGCVGLISFTIMQYTSTLVN